MPTVFRLGISIVALRLAVVLSATQPVHPGLQEYAPAFGLLDPPGFERCLCLPFIKGKVIL